MRTLCGSNSLHGEGEKERQDRENNSIGDQKRKKKRRVEERTCIHKL